MLIAYRLESRGRCLDWLGDLVELDLLPRSLLTLLYVTGLVFAMEGPIVVLASFISRWPLTFVDPIQSVVSIAEL